MVPSSFSTTQLSEILSTIFWIAIGAILKKLNFNIEIAKNNIPTVKDIGVTNTVISIIPK